MPQKTLKLLKAGLKANQEDSFRRGNLISLPGEGSLVVSGDIHGHRRNFERVVSFADLKNHPSRHVILQEIIHGGKVDADGDCLSFELLFDVIRYKLDFPDRVHLLMGNHDTAFINNSEVLKNGVEMNVSMRNALEKCFYDDCKNIIIAMSQFLFSQPLAVRSENRIWFSHSLPPQRYMEHFDKEIIHRPLKVNDIVRPASAYALTWGRNHSQELLNELAETFDVDWFVLGHQTQPKGWAQLGDNMLVVISEHNHGMLMELDLAKSYTMDGLIESIVPLASIS